MKTNMGIAGLCALLMCGCSQSASTDQQGPAGEEPVQIVLKGGIAGSATPEKSMSQPSSRAVIDNNYASPLAVAFARLDQEEGGTWPDYNTVSASLAATLQNGVDNRAIEFSVPQYYLSRNTNNNTRLVGWYPQGELNSGTVTFTIDGVTDIMLTEQLEGNKTDGNRFGEDSKIFTFNHQLTRINVKAYAVDAAAATVWGTISSDGIVLKNQSTSCSVALPATVSFGDEAADLTLPAKEVADDQPISYPLTLPVGKESAAACGYAMIRPVQGSTSILLTVTTEKGGTYEVTVPFANGCVAGSAYDLFLKFTATGIEPAATISAWQDGDDVEVIL